MKRTKPSQVSRITKKKPAPTVIEHAEQRRGAVVPRHNHERHACIDQRIEQNRCAEHSPDECPDQVVRRYSGPSSGDSYGLPIPPDFGGGYIQIDFCPFCGADLALPDTPAAQTPVEWRSPWQPSAFCAGALMAEVTAGGATYDLVAQPSGDWLLFQGSVFLSGEEATAALAQKRLLKIMEALTGPLL